MARRDYIRLKLFSGQELPVEAAILQFANMPLKDMRHAAHIAAEMISYRHLVTLDEGEDALAMAKRLSELSDVAELSGTHFSARCDYNPDADQHLEALHRFGISSVFKGLSLRYSLNMLFRMNAPDHAFFRDYATLSLLEIMAKSDKVAMLSRERKAIDRQFRARKEEFPQQVERQNTRLVTYFYDYIGETNRRH